MLVCAGGAEWLSDCALATPIPRPRVAIAARSRFFIVVSCCGGPPSRRIEVLGFGICGFPFSDGQEIGLITLG